MSCQCPGPLHLMEGPVFELSLVTVGRKVSFPMNLSWHCRCGGQVVQWSTVSQSRCLFGRVIRRQRLLCLLDLFVCDFFRLTQGGWGCCRQCIHVRKLGNYFSDLAFQLNALPCCSTPHFLLGGLPCPVRRLLSLCQYELVALMDVGVGVEVLFSLPADLFPLSLASKKLIT